MTTRASARKGSTPREKIFAAALELFATRGYEATTIEDIREASGASTGTIYHHFKSKQALAAALFVDGLASYQEETLDVIAQDPGGEAGVRAMVRHYLAWTAANRALAKFLLTTREPEVRAVTNERLRALNARFYGETEAWWRRKADAGEVRRLPPDIVRTVVFGPAEAFARRWLTGRTETPMDAASRHLEDAAWRAVRAAAER